MKALAAELLRLLPGLPLDDALVAEASVTPPMPTAASGEIHVTLSPAIALTLDQSALSAPMLETLREACEAAHLDHTPLTIAAAGPDFCLAAAAPIGLTRLYASIAAQTSVTIQGQCANGGLGFLLAGHVTARRDARFSATQPLPGFGAITALVRRIGAARAEAILLGGVQLDALTALSWGLIDAIA